MAPQKESTSHITANPGDWVFVTDFFGATRAFFEVIRTKGNRVVVEIGDNQVEIPARRAQVVIEANKQADSV